MKMCVVFVLFYQLTLLFAQLANRSTLKFSQVLFRHGHRTPRHTYGHYNQDFDRIWPEGLEQLTDLGKSQGFELGQFLRKRYDGFLSSTYNSQEIFILSSHIDRSIKTAACCAAGIYQKFNDASTWNGDPIGLPSFEPIPIRSIPAEYDNYLSMDAFCAQREQLKSLPWRSFFEKRFFKDQPEVLEYIFRQSEQTALFDPQSNSTEIHREYFAIQEIVNSLAYSNKTLENWMVPLLNNELFLSYPYILQLAEYTDGLQAQRLNAGALVERIIDNFQAYLKGTPSGKKLVLFSGHDKNMVIVMHAFGILSALQNRPPPYASALLMELHQLPEEDDLVIEFWFRKTTTKTLERVDSLPCGIPCTYRNLARLAAPLMKVNFETECKVTS